MATFPRRRRIYEACSCMPSYILARTRVKAFTYTYLNVVQCCPLRTHVGQDTEGALRFLKTHFIFVFFPFFFFLIFFFFFRPTNIRKSTGWRENENDCTTRIRDDTCLFTEETGLQIKLLLSILNIKHARC